MRMNGLRESSVILDSVAEVMCVLQGGAGGGETKGLCLSVPA